MKKKSAFLVATSNEAGLDDLRKKRALRGKITVAISAICADCGLGIPSSRLERVELHEVHVFKPTALGRRLRKRRWRKDRRRGWLCPACASQSESKARQR